MDRETATNLAHKYGIDLTEDFYALPAEQVGRILDAAVEAKYYKPKNANGSRCRYFHAALVRASRRTN